MVEYMHYIYLEAKWPLFCLEKALFWGGDLQKIGHWGSRCTYTITYIFIYIFGGSPVWHETSLGSKRRLASWGDIPNVYCIPCFHLLPALPQTSMLLSRVWSQDWLVRTQPPTQLAKPENPHNCSSSTISTSPSRSQPSKPAPHVSHWILRLLCASCLKPLGSRRSRILEKITKVEGVSGAWVGWIIPVDGSRG